jgi:hypothetical protein
LIHKRLPVQFLSRYKFLHRIARAHRVHHITGQAPYGLFRGPNELRQRHARKRASAAKRTAMASQMVEAVD